MPDLHQHYYVYMEDGDLLLGYSEDEGDEGVLVDYLGDVANVWDVLEKIRAHQQSIGT
jgi:hypothetical protein